VADRTLVAALVITAVNRASREIRQVAEDLKGIQKQTAGLREVASHLGVIGAASMGAGLGIAYGMKEAIGPAMEVEDQLHRLANTLPAGALGMRELADAQRATAATSEQLGIAQEGLLKQVYLGTSAGLDMRASIDAMNVASKLAIGLQGDLEETQRTLNLAFINFKDPSLTATQNIQRLGDVMATAAAKFDYRNIEELRSQLELATPTALAAGMGNLSGFKDMIAILADFTRHGLTGSVAGEALQESLHGVLEMQQKLGIPLARNAQGGIDLMRSLEGVRQHFVAMYGSMQAIPTPVLQEIQKTFGIRGMRALLLDQGEVEGMRAQLDQTAGAVARFSAEMLKSPAKQFAILSQTLRQIFIQLGNAMLPVLVSISKALLPVAKAAADFAQAHPQWVKMATVGLLISSAVLTIGGALALAGAALAGFGAVLPVLATLATGAGIAASAITGLNVAMLLNPAGLVIAGIVALGVGLYELREHWGAVTAAVRSVWTTITNFGSAMYDAGAHLMGELARGIASAAMTPVHAVESVAHRIRGFLPFSPAREGPLRDLHHVRIVQTIAETIRPAPMVSAMRRVAAAAAVALPLTMTPIAMPAFAAVAPALAASSAPTLSMESPAVRKPGVGVVSFSPTFTVNINHPNTGVDVEALRREVGEELQRRGHEMFETLRREQQKRARLEF